LHSACCLRCSFRRGYLPLAPRRLEDRLPPPRAILLHMPQGPCLWNAPARFCAAMRCFMPHLLLPVLPRVLPPFLPWVLTAAAEPPGCRRASRRCHTGTRFLRFTQYLLLSTCLLGPGLSYCRVCLPFSHNSAAAELLPLRLRRLLPSAGWNAFTACLHLNNACLPGSAGSGAATAAACHNLHITATLSCLPPTCTCHAVSPCHHCLSATWMTWVWKCTACWVPAGMIACLCLTHCLPAACRRYRLPSCLPPAALPAKCTAPASGMPAWVPGDTPACWDLSMLHGPCLPPAGGCISATWGYRLWVNTCCVMFCRLPFYAFTPPL